MTKPHQPCFIRRQMPEHVEKVHLIGIAGAGMGAFACMLKEAGYHVRGSDSNVYPPMSDVLTARGIHWMEGYDSTHLCWGPDLVIVGNVCRRDNPEAVAAEAGAAAAISFPQALCDLFLKDRHPIVVTGTHGKTTTTALCAWLLHHAGLDPGMLVGGLAANFGATYRLGDGKAFVVEGDEYDTAYFDKGPKFLHYRAKTVILNNIEFDHADIYDDLDEIIENFDRLMDQLTADAVLLANFDDPLVLERAARCSARVITYGFGAGADLRATEIEPGPSGCRFRLTVRNAGRDGELGRFHSPLAGRHNVWNTLAAFGAAMDLGVDPDTLREGITRFLGVGKRQEEKGEEASVLVIDDYGHHPTAIRLTLEALAARYPERRMWAVYEPKSNTARRGVHQEAYSLAFDSADVVILAKAYVKQDKLRDDEKLDIDRLVGDISDRGVTAIHLPDVPAIVDHLVRHTAPGDLVVFMSSSGFGGVHTKLLAALSTR